MFNVLTVLVKNSIRKEEKPMKRLMTIAVAMLVALNMAVPASAITSDVKNVLNAEADLETGISDLKLMSIPQLKNALTGADVSGSTISWTYDAAKTWKVADEYLEIGYQANLAGWGIQIYTDNMSASASPQWVEKPVNTSKPDAPAGLVGSGSVNYIAIPMAWKAFPGTTYEPEYSVGTGFGATTDYQRYYTEPSERAFGDPATDGYYIELYQAKTGSGASEKLYGKYCWLADKGDEKWIDADSDGEIDAGEIDNSYVDGADINKVVDYLGSSTCTYDANGTYIYRDVCASPIYVVLAAKIAAGTIKATYSTNTLTLELFHE